MSANSRTVAHRESSPANAWIRSPDSIFDCSTESAAITSLRRTASASISRFSAKLTPIALICVPGSIHRPSSTGVFDVVDVMTMSAPRTASSADDAGVTGMPSRSVISLANFSRRCASRPNARIRSSLRAAATASSCVRACRPVPMMPTVRASVSRHHSGRNAARRARAHLPEIVRFDQAPPVSPVSARNSGTTNRALPRAIE